MFTESCKKLRIMKGSEAIGLGMYYPINFRNTLYEYIYIYIYNELDIACFIVWKIN